MVRVICTDISGWEEGAYDQLWARATAQRRSRADRYRRREDGLRCLAAGALLRYALGTGGYTEERTEGGKPRIPDFPEFHYNLSHSGRWVVLAFGSSPVGVDVEQLRPDTDVDAMASRFFCREEQEFIRQGPDARRRFFEVWTRKESYLKYLGTGLKKSLTSFGVLRPEPGMQFFGQELPGGYLLSLYTREPEYTLELLDLQQLQKI